MITTTLTGDWGKLAKKLVSLPSNIKRGKKEGLDRVGELTVNTVQGHIASQDLGWSPLANSTIKQKGNDTILVETGTLQDAITHNVVDDNTIFIGAKQGTKYPSGEDINDVLKYHEFGTMKEPPRPLIRPSYNEVKPQAQKILKEEIINAIRD